MSNRPSPDEIIQKLNGRTGPSPKEIRESFARVKEQLIEEVGENGFTYVGPGSERRFGVTQHRLRMVVTMLKSEGGYNTHYLRLEHPDEDNSELVTVKVLTGDELSYKDVWAERDKILKAWADVNLTNES